MPLTVQSVAAPVLHTAIQGTSPVLQGTSPVLQGTSPVLQGSPNTIQVTAPASVLNTAKTITVPVKATTATGASSPAKKATAAPAKSAAQIAADNAAATARADYTALKNTTLNSIGTAIDTAGSGYNSSILDYLDSQKAGQRSIDAKAVQNELARQQGSQDILDMVGNGIRSGGVMLANSGAGSSSGSEAIARAYGTIGRQEQSKVGNEFASGQADIQADQDNLNLATETQKRKAQESKTQTINSIVNDATTKLASLNQSAAYASLPDRINIEQEIARIKQDAMNKLSAFDGQLSTGVTAAASPDSIRAQATNLRTAGVAPESAFDYTSETPVNFQNTGQFASSLPIFVSPNKKTTT